VLVLTGTIDEIDKPLAEAIVEHLRTITGDASLTLKRIEPGSIKLFLEGSQDGLERLETLIREGRLNEVMGLPIQAIQPSSSEVSSNLDLEESRSEILEVSKTVNYRSVDTSVATQQLTRETIRNLAHCLSPLMQQVREQMITLEPELGKDTLWQETIADYFALRLQHQVVQEGIRQARHGAKQAYWSYVLATHYVYC
jgi:hypothetical protein